MPLARARAIRDTRLHYTAKERRSTSAQISLSHLAYLPVKRARARYIVYFFPHAARFFPGGCRQRKKGATRDDDAFAYIHVAAAVVDLLPHGERIKAR